MRRTLRSLSAVAAVWGLDQLLQLRIDAKCIPILSTIPPMRNCPDNVTKANDLIRKLAEKRGMPLVDYYAAIEA